MHAMFLILFIPTNRILASRTAPSADTVKTYHVKGLFTDHLE